MITTDEINVLLERAGCEKVPVTVRVWNFGSRHGLGRQVESLQNTLILCSEHRQALAAALKKVLAERDAVLNERNYAVLELDACYSCNGCKYQPTNKVIDEPCLSCCRTWAYEEDDYWEFGFPILPKEDNR